MVSALRPYQRRFIMESIGGLIFSMLRRTAQPLPPHFCLDWCVCNAHVFFWFFIEHRFEFYTLRLSED